MYDLQYVRLNSVVLSQRERMSVWESQKRNGEQKQSQTKLNDGK